MAASVVVVCSLNYDTDILILNLLNTVFWGKYVRLIFWLKWYKLPTELYKVSGEESIKVVTASCQQIWNKTVLKRSAYTFIYNKEGWRLIKESIYFWTIAYNLTKKFSAIHGEAIPVKKAEGHTKIKWVRKRMICSNIMQKNIFIWKCLNF